MGPWLLLKWCVLCIFENPKICVRPSVTPLRRRLVDLCVPSTEIAHMMSARQRVHVGRRQGRVGGLAGERWRVASGSGTLESLKEARRSRTSWLLCTIDGACRLRCRRTLLLRTLRAEVLSA